MVVLCLMLLCGINESGKKEIIKQIKKVGDVDIVSLDASIYPKKDYRPEPCGRLSFRDLQLIKKGCPYVKKIGFYSALDFDELRIEEKSYEGYDYYSFPNLLGTSPEWIEVFNLTLKDGRSINNVDMLYRKRVCVLGGETYRLIGKRNIIGKQLITKNPDCKFTIVGVFNKKMPLFTMLPEETGYELLSREGERLTLIAEESISKNLEIPNKILKQGTGLSHQYDLLNINNNIYIPFTTWQDITSGKNLFITSKGSISFQNKSLDKTLFSSSSIPPRSFISLTINSSYKGKDKEGFFIDKEGIQVFKKSQILSPKD